MHQLDGNSSDLSQMLGEIEQHRARLEAQGLEPDQYQLDPAWLAAVKQAGG
jgi:hypothetical protein